MYSVFFKPLLDRTLALLLLLLISPILLLVAIAIMLTIGQPILFRQARPGKDEKIFTIYKFRTMSSERDQNGELLSDEKRLKGFGKIIRSLSLDELPQLFNVLRGEMSFIGPRPLLVEYLSLYNTQQKKRHDVLPGITGWAQVNGRNAIEWEKKFELDCYYTEHFSFKMDMKIILMTLQKVLLRDGISSTQSVTMEKFRGTK
jgi:undecaprenyl phosphate N,N'-diacetylbacillosamine 1-phosphate transferase